MFHKLINIDTTGIVDDSISLMQTDFNKVGHDIVTNLISAKDNLVDRSIAALKVKIKPTIPDLAIAPIVTTILNTRKDGDRYKTVYNPSVIAQIFIRYDYDLSLSNVDMYTNYRFDLDTGRSLLNYALIKGSYKCVEYMINKTEENIANVTAAAQSNVDSLMDLINESAKNAKQDREDSSDIIFSAIKHLRDNIRTYTGTFMYFQKITESTHSTLSTELDLIISNLYDNEDGSATLIQAEKFSTSVNTILDSLAVIELQHRDVINILTDIDQFLVNCIETISSILSTMTIYRYEGNDDQVDKLDAQRVNMIAIFNNAKLDLQTLIDNYKVMNITYPNIVTDVLDDMIVAHPDLTMEFTSIKDIVDPKIDSIQTLETAISDNINSHIITLSTFITNIDNVQTNIPVDDSDVVEPVPLSPTILPTEVIDNMKVALNTLRDARDKYNVSDAEYNIYNTDYNIMKSEIETIDTIIVELNTTVNESVTLYDSNVGLDVKDSGLTSKKSDIDTQYINLQSSKLIIDTISDKYGLMRGTEEVDPVDVVIGNTVVKQPNLISAEYGLIKFRAFIQNLFYRAIIYSHPDKNASMIANAANLLIKGNLYKLWKRCKPFIDVAAYGENGSELYGSQYTISISTLNIILPIIHDNVLNIDYVIPSDMFIPVILQEWLDYTPQYESGFNSERCIHEEIKRRLHMVHAPGPMIAGALNGMLKSSLAILGLTDLVTLMTHGDRWLYTFTNYLDKNDYIGDMIR